MGERTPVTVSIGAVYVATGMLLLLLDLDIITINWSLLYPVLLMAAGALVLSTGALWRSRRRQGGTKR